jgi:hypothetical protein
MGERAVATENTRHRRRRLTPRLPRETSSGRLSAEYRVRVVGGEEAQHPAAPALLYLHPELSGMFSGRSAHLGAGIPATRDRFRRASGVERACWGCVAAD